MVSFDSSTGLLFISIFLMYFWYGYFCVVLSSVFFHLFGILLIIVSSVLCDMFSCSAVRVPGAKTLHISAMIVMSLFFVCFFVSFSVSFFLFVTILVFFLFYLFWLYFLTVKIPERRKGCSTLAYSPRLSSW